MDNNKKATLELGTKPVKKLLLQYAMPAIIAMTAASLYNIIDRIFIGQVVGPKAIAGLAITFPFMNLAAAFGAAVGIGSSTTISVKLGQKDYATAQNILGNTISLNILIGISFAIISLIFINPILTLFGASAETIVYARDFMEIILYGNVFSHLYFGLNAVLRAASKPKMAMYITIGTVILNIIFDVIFITWWGWGIRGAAFATILSQIIALVWQIKIFANKKELLHLQKGIYWLKKKLVNNIISIGISPFLMNVCACLIIIFINNKLEVYGGDMSVGAYGISYSIAMVFIMIVIGLNQGMQPIAGYNYGAQLYDRMMKSVKLTIITATIITTFGWLIAYTVPQVCARLFTTNPDLIEKAVKAIRITMTMFPFIGIQMVITNFFQCIGKVKISIFLSLSRQLLFLLPLLIILPYIFKINGVWAAMPLSDLIAVIVAVIVMTRYISKQKKSNPIWRKK